VSSGSLTAVYPPPRSVPSTASRSYSCCCCTKIGDPAGRPDSLSPFAPSDQLSHLNNCFHLFSFHSPIGLDTMSSPCCFSLVLTCSGHSKVCLLSPIAVSFSIDCVCASVLISVYLSEGFPSCCLSCSSVRSCRGTNRCTPSLLTCPGVCTINVARPSSRPSKYLL